ARCCLGKATQYDGTKQTTLVICVVLHRDFDAGLGQLLEAAAREIPTATFYFGHPALELPRLHPEEVEPHVIESLAIVIGITTLVFARLVNHCVELCLHARHRINLPGKGR